MTTLLIFRTTFLSFILTGNTKIELVDPLTYYLPSRETSLTDPPLHYLPSPLVTTLFLSPLSRPITFDRAHSLLLY